MDILNGRLSIAEFAEKTGFPIVKAKVAIFSQENKVEFKRNLIVDFGNPMLVFLMSQYGSVNKAIKRGQIIPQYVRDANGNVVAQGIYADAVNVCGQEYNDVSIGLTSKMTAIEEMVFLGIPFFNSAVAFDFDNGLMVIL